MRIYQVKNKKDTLIVAAHNQYQAKQVANLKDATAEEINIQEPVIICNG